MNDPQPSFNPTHVRNRTLALVLVLMLLASALAARFLLIQQERFHLETINDRRKTAEAILSAMSAELKERYQARIISFANSKPEIFRAFADRDRERLLELVTPYYRHMHRENPYFTQISFVTPDRKAFLRTTLPRLFGDDASDISPLMVEAITRRETMAGFEAGFIEPVLRVIQPVFAHNEFQGVFCFSIKAQQLVDMAHRALGLSAILAEPKGLTSRKMPKSNRFPGKTHYFYFHDDTPPFFRDNAGQLSVDDEVIHLHWGKRYLDLYTGHVLRDGHGREIARILLLQDSTATAHRHRNTVIRLTILTTGLGLATALLLWFGFNRILGQILSLNQELEQTRKNLEERVKERTSTLLELNQELEDKVLELDQAQEVVRQGMLDWQRTFDAIKDVITILDADKIVVRANQAAESLLGRSPEELVGLSCREVYDSPAACAECHRDRIGKACETSEIEFRHPPTGRWFHVSVNPFCEDGEVMGYVHVTRDVTRRKLLEQHLARSRRMESIATLAGGIAHDFNNILGAILGNADLILYRMSMRNAGADATAHPSPAPEEIREYIDAIRAAGLRARDLVAQVLAFGRRTDTPRLDIDITPTVKEGIKLLRSSLPPKIELRADIQPLKRRIRANPTEVHQMLTNLCSNAVRAMGDQGLLEISLREMEISGKEKPQVPDLRPGCHIRLTVRDSGPGLSPEVRERLFDPFFTTRDVGEGSGLGLSVVYGIMQDYGGAVAVRSEPGEPTEFSLYFPCSVENEDKGSPANMLLNVPGGTERILIVDDEEDLVTMQVRILNYLGYDVVSALSGNEALEICRQDDTGFDLLFTDLFMPDMPGPQLAREVKALYPEIRIILASGRADAVSEEERRASGIDLVVRKPLDISAMAQALRSVLDREGRDGKAS